MNSHFIYDGVKSVDWCKNLIPYVKGAYPAVESTIGFAGAHVDEKFRKSTLRWLNKDVEVEIRNMIWSIVTDANRYAFGVDISYLNDIQFTEYQGDRVSPGKYGWHHDIDWQDPKFLQRKISFVMFLNDESEYEGGRLMFRDINISIKQKAGTVIVFPSFYVHEVTPVTQGARYSLVSWVEGPKWR